MTMIYDIQSLKNQFNNYSNIEQRICKEVSNGSLVRIKNGLYTNNLKIDALIISNICYGPSYISFEYALSFYGLIPEYVTMITSATYNKKNRKNYNVKGFLFEYRSVPNDVYTYGIRYLENEEGIKYKIATKEKALCDTIYSKYPVRTIKDLKILLFEDLRIDEEEFEKLDFNFIIGISELYHSNSVKVLAKYVKGIR